MTSTNNPINDMYDLIEENARLERVLLIQKQHIAELVKWEAVFGHLGTPDEVGNEWLALCDKNTRLLEALKWMVLRTEEGGYPDGRCLEEARAAIAKATGEQP